MNFFQRSIASLFNIRVKEELKPQLESPKEVRSKLPSSRSSVPNLDSYSSFNNFKGNLRYVSPDFTIETIPTLRKLYKTNSDMGLAVHDMVTLTNTGFEVFFDPSVKPEKVNEMRAHLKNQMKKWSPYTGGLTGFLNKLIAQVWLTGAISAEWIPHNDLTRIKDVTLVDTEYIRFVLNTRSKEYHPYQQVDKLTGVNQNRLGKNRNLKKLNTNTYKYISINGDSEAPYGIPPFITALASLDIQDSMTQNIKTIVDQVGLMGFLEVLMAKPHQMPNENITQYEARLNNLLTETRDNIKSGFKDGVMVGYDEDHEFQFHSTTKNISGLAEIFNLNEVQVSNGLKQSPSFLGVAGKGSETAISIVFTKMLSQLTNIQELVAEFLEYGFKLELTLAGYNFKGLEVRFNKSTVTDDLKLWQAKEIKQRVLRALHDDGIIGQFQYADEMGYIRPDKAKARIDRSQPAKGNDQADDQKKKEDREADKDKSDRKGRDKKKDQPKRKDQDTKER